MWQVETIRVTAFPLNALAIEQVDWWKELMNADPEIDNKNLKKGERIQEGNFSNGKLRLTITAERIDWYFVPLLNPDGDFPPRLGDATTKIDEFVELLRTWLDSDISIKRLALGTVLSNNVENHKQAYELLSSQLPNVDIDVDNSYEFGYQINRPRFIEIPSIDHFKINRLSQWNATKGVAKVTKGNESFEKKFFVARLTLDVNTDAEFSDEIPSQSLPVILDNLVQFSKEIIESGDIA